MIINRMRSRGLGVKHLLGKEEIAGSNPAESLDRRQVFGGRSEYYPRSTFLHGCGRFYSLNYAVRSLQHEFSNREFRILS